MINTVQKDQTTTPEELEQYKEQFGTALHQTLRFAFGVTDAADALDNLQKVLDEMPSSVADDLSINVESLSRTIMALKETAGQTSLFPEDEEEAMESKVMEAIPHLIGVVPKEYLMPNHKLMNELTRDLVGAGKTHLSLSSNNAKKPLFTVCDLAYDNEKIKIESRRPLTEYDRNVYNAATSLFVLGDPSHVVTPAMVYRAMTGMSDQETPSRQQLKAVTDSLNRMSSIRVRIDCKAELEAYAKAHNLKFTGDGHIRTYLLDTKEVYIKAGGKEFWAYKIKETPVLYEHSKKLNQVISVPSRLLDIRAVDAETGQIMDRIASTESRIAIKGYLLRRIEGMKNEKNKLQSRSISLLSYERDGRHHAGLYEIAGNAEPSRVEARRIRDYVAAALEYWKAECYIREYTWIKRGKKIVSVEIQI